MLNQAKFKILNELNQLEKKQEQIQSRLQNAIKDKGNYAVRQSRYDYETDEDFEYGKWRKQTITDTIFRYNKQIKQYDNKILALYLNNKNDLEFLYNQLINEGKITSYKRVRYAEDLTPYLEEYIPPKNSQVPSNQSQVSQLSQPLIPVPEPTPQQPLSQNTIFKQKKGFY